MYASMIIRADRAKAVQIIFAPCQMQAADTCLSGIDLPTGSGSDENPREQSDEPGAGTTSECWTPVIGMVETVTMKSASHSGTSLLQAVAHSHYVTENLMLGIILLVVLIIMAIGSLPTWPHSRSWGYGPTGVVSLMLTIAIVVMLMGRV